MSRLIFHMDVNSAFLHTPLRLLGIALTDLTHEEQSQLSLFPDEDRERARRLDKAYDAINSRFGASAIMRGSSVQSKLEVGKKYRAQMEQKQKTDEISIDSRDP